MKMKVGKIYLVLGVLIFLAAFFPLHNTQAAPARQGSLPPIDMFQLPWEQGLAWYLFDGLDNGTYRGPLNQHLYTNGGAVDFGPRLDIQPGDDTSSYWVTAAAAGTVIERGSCHLKIDHGNGWVTEYQFLADFQVGLGDEVYRNQKLATIADGVRTPFCPPLLNPDDIPHVHFSLRPNTWNATLAGWQVTYDPATNVTVFVRNGETATSYMPPPILNGPALQIVDRGVLEENILYHGSIDAYRYERWTIDLAQTRSFTITANGVTAGLQPLIVLLNASGTEVARGTGVLTTLQPAGHYFVLVQPQSGQGFYEIILQDSQAFLEPYILVRAPANLSLGEQTTVEAFLGNIPSNGYASVEVSCPYNAGLLGVNNIVGTNLFGGDPVTAISGPQNGSFIFSVAGSQGQRAYADGTVFNFQMTGLSPGETFIQCSARVSYGDGTLHEIIPIGTSLTISDTPLDPYPGEEPVPDTFLSGQVFANKPVTIHLYDQHNSLVNTSGLDVERRFIFNTAAETYTVLARAEGYLPARALIAVSPGSTTTLSTVSLMAGDIDGNFTVDEFDALSIGMNYNTASPSAADLNADGVINVLDLELLAANYHASGVQIWE